MTERFRLAGENQSTALIEKEPRRLEEPGPRLLESALHFERRLDKVRSLSENKNKSY